MKKRVVVLLAALLFPTLALADSCTGSVSYDGCQGCYLGGAIGWGSYRTWSRTDTYSTVNGTCKISRGNVSLGSCGSC